MASSTTHPPFQHFFTLPAEIRVRIYRFLFGSATTVRIPEQQLLPSANSAALRFKGSMAIRRNEVDREHRDFMLEATRFLRADGGLVKDDENPDRSVTAILQVCQQMHEEASPEFYREAQVHFSISARLPLSISTLELHLPMIRHLSLDYSFLNTMNSGRYDGRRDHDHRRPDKEMAECIEYCVDQCRALRTFTLHVLSDIRCSSCNSDLMHIALEHAELTPTALCKLKVRDLITIIAVGDSNSYLVFRTTVAPQSDWKCNLFCRWPGMRLTSEQRKASEQCLMDSQYEHSAIWAWHHRPPTSKLGTVANWKFLEPGGLGDWENAEDDLGNEDRSETDTAEDTEEEMDNDTDESTEMDDSSED